MPHIQFVGVDFNAKSVDIMKTRCASAGLANVECLVGLIEEYDGAYDLAVGMAIVFLSLSVSFCLARSLTLYLTRTLSLYTYIYMYIANVAHLVGLIEEYDGAYDLAVGMATVSFSLILSHVLSHTHKYSHTHAYTPTHTFESLALSHSMYIANVVYC